MTDTTISCCIECGSTYVPKAQYALSTLLRPMGLEPVWVPRNVVGPGDIYYGSNANLVVAQAVRIPLADATETYFSRRSLLQGYPSSVDAHGLLRLFPGTESAPTDDDAQRPLSWDPIASAFFFLSGWQEWVDDVRDIHGRFPYARSVLARYGTPYDPMVDRYGRFLEQQLTHSGRKIHRRLWKGRKSAVCITHDIDYHKKWRPGILYGETVKHVLRHSAGGRIRGAGRLAHALIMSAIKGDPFRRSLDELLQTELESGFGATWFLKADAHGKFDVAYPLDRGWAKRVVKRLEQGGFEIGLHTSYFAADHPGYVEREKARLESATSQLPRSIRSHYLRWLADRTMRSYADSGFTIDSTLGFAEQEGFRHATTLPFKLFDPAANVELDIWEMPVAVMDTTLYGYRDLSLQEGIDVTLELLKITQDFGGVLVLLWHNIMLDELGNERLAPHFKAIVDSLGSADLCVDSLRDSLSTWQ